MDRAAKTTSESLERVIPELLQSGEATGEESLRLHLARYEFAATHAHAGRVLDLACGVGYGTFLLAERRPDITALGVDVSPEAIDYARQRYAHSRISFVVADAMTFHDPKGFDSIVSLETIEHLPAPELFFHHLVGQLIPGGVVVASVPTTASMDANPHHLHDFTERFFRRMIQSQGLEEIAALQQVQPYRLLPLLMRHETRAKGIRRGLLQYYFRHPASLGRRINTLFRYGFTNRYLTVAARKLPM